MIRTLQLCFTYPQQDTLTLLRQRVDRLPVSTARVKLRLFLRDIQTLELHQWEELYTRTFDLSPLVAPYVGHATYGEDYRRGSLMAELSGEYHTLGVDLQGELPDHLLPVLGYLEYTRAPLPELLSLLEPAVQSMKRTLHRMEPHNPYMQVLLALEAHLPQLLRRSA